MAEEKESGAKKEKEFDPDERFRYIGFEVHPGKIKELFKSEAEKDKWVKGIQEKRKKGAILRDSTSFDVPRVASYEKIVLTVASLILIFSIFLPWFSGYQQYEVEAVKPAAPVAAMADSLGVVDSLGMAMTAADSSAVVATETVTDTAALAADMGEVEETGEETGTAEVDRAAPEKDEHGFAAVSGVQRRKEIRREYQSASAVASLGHLGDVFSSGIILKITGLLFLIYMLFCIFGAFYTIYNLYFLKGDPDTSALRLKKAMRFAWVPVAIWVFCLIISFFGASYSFDTTDMMVQIGTGYGVGTYLGILSYGFYISLACFILSGAKAIEI